MPAEGKRASAIDAHYHSKLTKDPREEAYVLILVHDSKKRHQCITTVILVAPKREYPCINPRHGRWQKFAH